MQAVNTRIDQLEQQLNKNFPPLAELPGKVTTITEEMNAHIAAFKIVDNKVTSMEAAHEATSLSTDENSAAISTLTAETANNTKAIKEIQQNMSDADKAFDSNRKWSLEQVGKLATQVWSLPASSGSGPSFTTRRA